MANIRCTLVVAAARLQGGRYSWALNRAAGLCVHVCSASAAAPTRNRAAYMPLLQRRILRRLRCTAQLQRENFQMSRRKNLSRRHACARVLCLRQRQQHSGRRQVLHQNKQRLLSITGARSSGDKSAPRRCSQEEHEAETETTGNHYFAAPVGAAANELLRAGDAVDRAVFSVTPAARCAAIAALACPLRARVRSSCCASSASFSCAACVSAASAA